MSVQSVWVAKERLRSLLIADRIKCTPDIAEKLSDDIYCTISKYMTIRRENFQIQITHSDIHIKYTGEKD